MFEAVRLGLQTATPWMQYHNHTCTKAPRDIAWYFRGLRAGHKLGDQPALHDVTTVRMLAKLFYPPGPLTSESASKVESSTAVSVAFCLVIGRVVLASESCQERYGQAPYFLSLLTFCNFTVQ